MLRGSARGGDPMASEAPSPVERDRLEEHPLWKKAAAWFIELRSEQVSSERIAEWLRWLKEETRRAPTGLRCHRGTRQAEPSAQYPLALGERGRL